MSRATSSYYITVLRKVSWDPLTLEILSVQPRKAGGLFHGDDPVPHTCPLTITIHIPFDKAFLALPVHIHKVLRKVSWDPVTLEIL
ncbi:unnamed protein product, partial [Didymodactylos carnosus]